MDTGTFRSTIFKTKIIERGKVRADHSRGGLMLFGVRYVVRQEIFLGLAGAKPIFRRSQTVPVLPIEYL